MMAKVLCVLYYDPADGYPPAYARDGIPRIESYHDGPFPSEASYLDGGTSSVVVTVLKGAEDGGGYVLVNRGWLPRNADVRTAIAPYRTPTGEVAIEGIARANASRAFELGEGGSAAHQQIRQNLDVAAFASETALPLQPFVIEQTSDDNDALVRDWPAPTTGVERNYGYMFQWWGMAAAALGFGLYAARRAAKKEI